MSSSTAEEVRTRPAVQTGSLAAAVGAVVADAFDSAHGVVRRVPRARSAVAAEKAFGALEAELALEVLFARARVVRLVAVRVRRLGRLDLDEDALAEALVVAVLRAVADQRRLAQQSNRSFLYFLHQLILIRSI